MFVSTEPEKTGDPVIRIAAKGDAITESGVFVKGAAPGDVVTSDGTVNHGPNRVEPACRHFAQCGGCQLQHCADNVLTDFVTDRVVNAAKSQGVEIGDVLSTHLSPPRSRRRATLHGLRRGKQITLGYKQEKSHKLVDLAECPVLVPALTDMIKPVRKLLGAIAGRAPVDIQMTQTDQGVSVAIKGVEIIGLEATEAVLDFAKDQALARLSFDQGFGDEPIWEPEPVTVTLGGVPVAFPSGAFLQATADAQSVMIDRAREWVPQGAKLADLFAGLGTFAFSLADKVQGVTAYEAALEAHLSCRAAANRGVLPISCEHRDLFRNPLDSAELNQFDTVLLDPPRAGAKEQIGAIAGSELERVIYISCNPSSWARDAARLQEQGFCLEALQPIGQFRWSTHVELASLFVR